MGLVEKLHCAFNNVDTSLTSTENRENRLRRASGLVHANPNNAITEDSRWDVPEDARDRPWHGSSCPSNAERLSQYPRVAMRGSNCSAAFAYRLRKKLKTSWVQVDISARAFALCLEMLRNLDSQNALLPAEQGRREFLIRGSEVRVL
jgi:hypothetical protein